jgi:hypothetical protein
MTMPENQQRRNQHHMRNYKWGSLKHEKSPRPEEIKEGKNE